MAAVAATLRLPRLAEEAAFFAQGRLAPPEQLEAWAADRAGARTRCRWGRWWLGADGPLDPLEAAPFEATALPGWQRADGVTGPEAWAPGWGLDQARGVVWCGPEVVGDLSRHATLRGLLEALLDLGGRADKEQLIARAWGIDDYHPLQHDNRLRVAVRKLRGRLGPAGAEVIETLEDGYALVGVWRILGG
ncbi:MAG: helix-turn-helix domain-containing protein [Myxococcales bacterium]|nr:helix-turn-helix domain-containing protein [Myxococcales bacterium]